MTSFVETHEDSIDFNTIQTKLKDNPSKCFSFFLFYSRKQHHNTATSLQKLAFSLKEDKNNHADKQEHSKLIQLHFADLENQQELEQSLFELKAQLLESPKTKLVFYSEEQQMTQLLHKAKFQGIDLSHVPSALYSPDLHQDLAQHLGWKEPLLDDISLKSSHEFEENVKKWIGSPGQRIDMWTASVAVSNQGSIHRMNSGNGTFALVYEKQIQQHFLSHISIGHHAQLAANYQSNRKQHHHSVMNRFIFNFESLKKFCCVGNPSLENSTGIVSVLFQDQKGKTQEITKELVKEGSKRGVLSLLFSNIDKFMGMKLEGGRLSDSKLEMGVYQSSKEYRRITSMTGDIVVRFNASEVFISIGGVCYRLQHPRQLRISQWGKVKLLISKDSLEC